MKKAMLLLLMLALCQPLASAQPDAVSSVSCALAIPIVALEFATYDLNWLRYKNGYGEGRLNIAGVANFPTERVDNGDEPIHMSDLETGCFIEELIASHDIAYDEERISGSCDTARLKGISSDVLCVPGSKGMPNGNVFLALYHPETFEIVAVTTSIDNSFGGAVALSNLPAPSAEARQTAPSNDDGCGPYGNGQWIKRQAYQDSGLSLPVADEGVGSAVTDYQCIVPENGAPYLQAYYIDANWRKAHASDSNDDGGGGGGDGGGGGGAARTGGSNFREVCENQGGTYSSGTNWEGCDFDH